MDMWIWGGVCLLAITHSFIWFLVSESWRKKCNEAANRYYQYGKENERGSAIRAGVGKWVVNPKTGEITFVYGCDNCPKKVNDA